jgi:hypothetical protein
MPLIQTTRAPLRTSSAPRGCSLQFGNLWYKKLTHQICLYYEPDRLWDFGFFGSGSWTVTPCCHDYLKYVFCGFSRNVLNHAHNYTASNLDHTVNSAGLSVGLSFTWCTAKQFSVKQNRKSHHSSSVLSQRILTTLYCIYLSASFIVFQRAGLCVRCFLFAASEPLIWEAVSLSFDLMSNVIVSPIGSH